LIVLMGMFALGNGISALAPSYHWMLIFRFLSGLPHGAYFGVTALVAASLVPENRRTVALVRVFLGLTFATIIGVPLANLVRAGRWVALEFWAGCIAGCANDGVHMAVCIERASASGVEPAARTRSA
jgi:DHA1 family inner membrane transport protein